MSKENVKKFYEAVVADEGLRMRLSDLNKEYQGEAVDEKNKSALVEKLLLPIAEEKGLPFTMAELQEYNKELSLANVNGELSSDELDAVSGGVAGLGLAFCSGIGGIAGIEIALCFILGI